MKLAPSQRIKPKYHPVPNAAERRHHHRLMELPCTGCGIEPAGVVHHVLGHIQIKRWRRDHRIVVPVCHVCHRFIHEGEAAWEIGNAINLGEVARFLELESVNMGIL